MSKYFNVNGGIRTDMPNFLPAQLPAQHNPPNAHSRTQQHAGQRMHCHLRGTVNLHLGRNLATHLHNAQILYDKGIHANPCCKSNHLLQLGHFPVGYQRVQCQVNRHTSDMAILHRLFQCLRCKIFGALAGVKAAAAQINGIRAVLHRSTQRIH